MIKSTTHNGFLRGILSVCAVPAVTELRFLNCCELGSSVGEWVKEATRRTAFCCSTLSDELIEEEETQAPLPEELRR
jgi:hypothetical protein